MNIVLEQIIERLAAAEQQPDFLDVLFEEHKQNVQEGAPVVLFGAGSLGQELCIALNNNGINPICFCDSDDSKNGNMLCGIPIISVDELKNIHNKTFVMIATKNHTKAVRRLLLDNGFCDDKLLCKEPDIKINMAFLYAISITQLFINGIKQQFDKRSVLDKLKKSEDKLLYAYNLFADQKSRDLFVSKLAFLASKGNLFLFGEFIRLFSEPFRDFGFDNFSAPPEDFYYFNNDVISLSQDEVYVDVGAFDGDTIQTFVQACDQNQVEYKHIYALEPDPQCYLALLKNTSTYKKVSYHQLGLWSESKVLQFNSSVNSAHDQAASISTIGDSEIQVVALDDILQGEKVTFIKMDPGGNVIPAAVKGAARTIAQYKPKLALGAYHAVESIYEIPLLVHNICPEYRLYLRHNTYHPCDTDLYATI